MIFVRQYGETDFITGLRAIAATMVVIIHTGAFAHLGWLGENITGAGKFGVQMFFVISGFTIATTYRNANTYGQYLIRRIFRMTPAYYATLLTAILLTTHQFIPTTYWANRFGVENDTYSILMHLLYLSFIDYRIANSILAVEWSIPIEMFWYIFLPYIIHRAVNIKQAFIAMAFLLVASIVTRIVSAGIGTSAFANFFPTTYGAYFMLGVIAYLIRSSYTERIGKYRPLLLWSGCMIFFLAVTLSPSGSGALIGTATALVIASHTQKNRLPFLDNVLFKFIGSISYSVYLWHMILILVVDHWIGYTFSDGLTKFMVIYLGTLGLSILTYALIEKPTNALGARVAQRWS